MDLYHRLKVIKQNRIRDVSGRKTAGTDGAGIVSAGTGENGTVSADSTLDISPGPEWFRKDRGVWERTVVVPLARTFGEGCVGRDGTITLSPVFQRGDKAVPVMFDLETTGLSGGSGNVAFLAGFGTLSSPDSVAVRQIFLSDYGYESGFVEAIASFLADPCAGNGLLVSYNGASFDMPLLTGRFIMNGRPPVVCNHLDLLHVSRALWKKSLENCRLGTVEREVLGLLRSNDLPGSLAPYRYRDFHRTGDIAVVKDVFDHHLYDIAHLGALLLHLNGIFLGSHDEGIPGSDYDVAALVRLLWERGGDRERSRVLALTDRLIGKATGVEPASGNRPVPGSGPTPGDTPVPGGRPVSGSGPIPDRPDASGAPRSKAVLKAVRYRGYIEKRRARYEEAFSIFSALWHESRCYRDGREAAVIAEHRLRNPEKALALCRLMEAATDIPVGIQDRIDLKRRVERLEQKCRRRFETGTVSTAPGER